jgi:hypothetical protein
MVQLEVEVRQTADSAGTHQSDETQRLDAYIAILYRQNEELKAKVTELEAALKRKTEATNIAPKEEGSEA